MTVFAFIAEFRQTPCTELFTVVHRQFGNRIECTHRYGRINTGIRFSPSIKALTALHVFVIRPRVYSSGASNEASGNLTDQGGPRRAWQNFKDGISHFLILGNQRTDTDAASGITPDTESISTTFSLQCLP